MASLKDYKFIRPKFKAVVNGYIREVQTLFPFDQNSYYNIPVSINHLCAIYYDIRGAFNTKLCAMNLKFIDDHTVEKINNSMHALCLFGEPITDEMCNIFRIEFTVTRKGALDKFCPYFGIAAAASPSQLMLNFELLRNWNINYPNANKRKFQVYSVSLFNKGAPPLQFHGSFLKYRQIREVQQKDVHVGNTFMIVYNFKQSKCTLLHNDIQLYEESIKEKCIIPFLSIYFKGEMTKVTKYEFE